PAPEALGGPPNQCTLCYGPSRLEHMTAQATGHKRKPPRRVRIPADLQLPEAAQPRQRPLDLPAVQPKPRRGLHPMPSDPRPDHVSGADRPSWADPDGRPYGHGSGLVSAGWPGRAADEVRQAGGEGDLIDEHVGEVSRANVAMVAEGAGQVLADEAAAAGNWRVR